MPTKSGEITGLMLETAGSSRFFVSTVSDTYARFAWTIPVMASAAKAPTKLRLTVRMLSARS